MLPEIIDEGSRHSELLREMNARLHEFIRTKSLEEIRQMCIKFNNLYCRPPLDMKEFESMWNDAITHVTEQEMEKDTKNSMGTRTELISVAEAIRRSSGKVAVNGLIVGMSSVIQVIKETEFECSRCGQSDTELYNPPLFAQPRSYSNSNKRKCVSCNSITYGPKRNTEISAMIIQLQDEKKQNELENLNVVLFDSNTLNVRNCEKAMVAGELHVIQQSSGISAKRITYLFANLLEYETIQNESTVVTEQDILEVEEFAKQPDMISKLTNMLAPTVIGHDDKKLGIILMYIGAPETEDFRGRIHGLFIGPPGTAKTKLGRARL